MHVTRPCSGSVTAVQNVLLIHFEMVHTQGLRMSRYCWIYAAIWRLKADTQGDAVFTLTSERVPCSTFLFCGILWKNTETVLQDVCIEICQGMWHYTLSSCSKVTVSSAKCLTSFMTEKLMFPWNASTAESCWKVFLESLLSVTCE